MFNISHDPLWLKIFYVIDFLFIAFCLFKVFTVTGNSAIDKRKAKEILDKVNVFNNKFKDKLFPFNDDFCLLHVIITDKAEHQIWEQTNGNIRYFYLKPGSDKKHTNKDMDEWVYENDYTMIGESLGRRVLSLRCEILEQIINPNNEHISFDENVSNGSGKEFYDRMKKLKQLV